MIDLILHILAWFAMTASIFVGLTVPWFKRLDHLTPNRQRRIMVEWARKALEAVAITLLALRVLGKI